MKPNLRRCLICRKIGEKTEFYRVVRLPSGVIQLDKGMGRSAYLCPTGDCLHLAKKKDRLARSLKTQIPPEIYQALQQLQPQPKKSP
jgi:uncharacterized protein